MTTANITMVGRKENNVSLSYRLLYVPHNRERWRVTSNRQVISIPRPTACHLVCIAKSMVLHAREQEKMDRIKNKKPVLTKMQEWRGEKAGTGRNEKREKISSQSNL